eukprot:CAMPEP_0119343844 /NCGR_PEP_ID=MMETSP1333-20130426/106663_1 /TAXON_ID=418940 /ORGANISM="Scyphosphaera apsteinii, Strain RCC1455" /LENGTH=248 /DNA_ID=CAMNT_0007356259 /DNA_START=277 /DNA_END=1018 /DNA_ORIENTATION=-
MALSCVCPPVPVSVSNFLRPNGMIDTILNFSFSKAMLVTALPAVPLGLAQRSDDMASAASRGQVRRYLLAPRLSLGCSAAQRLAAWHSMALRRRVVRCPCEFFVNSTRDSYDLTHVYVTQAMLVTALPAVPLGLATVRCTSGIRLTRRQTQRGYGNASILPISPSPPPTTASTTRDVADPFVPSTASITARFATPPNHPNLTTTLAVTIASTTNRYPRYSTTQPTTDQLPATQPPHHHTTTPPHRPTA